MGKFDAGAPGEDESLQAQVSVLESEISSVSARIQTLMLENSRIMSIGIPLLVAVLGLAFKEKLYFLILTLPIIFFILIYFWLDLGSETVSLGGYRRFLEDRVNSLIGDRLLVWEGAVAETRHHGTARAWLRSIYAVAMLSFIGSSIAVCIINGWREVLYLSLAAYTTLSVGFVICYRAKGLLFRHSYQLAWAAYRADTGEGHASRIGEVDERNPDRSAPDVERGGHDALLKQLQIQWDDFFQTRSQTWQSLYATIVFSLVFVLSDSLSKNSDFTTFLSLPVLATAVSGVILTMHHRKVQVRKFQIISGLEKSLGITFQVDEEDGSGELKLPESMSIIHAFDPRKRSTPLFIIRCYIAILAFLVGYVALRSF